MDDADFEGILKEKTHLLDRRATTEAPKPPPKTIPRTVTATSLNELDPAKELLEQYKNAKDVLDSVITDEAIAPNQKAQVLNTVSSILQNIAKTQQELYNVERLKLIENTLIETLQSFPEVKAVFLDAYEKALKAAE